MSLDGTFRCHAALGRLLARYPTLQSNPRLSSLSQKGEGLTADDVVGAMAEPFLHPSYTVPIMGCFRPLNRRIVEKAVELLRRVPGLREDSSKEELAEIEEDDVGVVEFYVRRKKGLRLHEAACLALCRALDLAPSVMGIVLDYFKFSPPPFQRFSTLTAGFQPSKKEVRILTGAIRVSFRYLLMAPNDFSKLWNWSSLSELVQSSADAGLGCVSIRLDDWLDIKWCIIQILTVVLRMSDRATTRFGLQADEALACFLRWDEFCQDTALEKASWYFQATESEASQYFDETNTFCPWNFFETQSSVFRPCSERMGFKLRDQMDSRVVNSDGSCFVLTSALQKSYEMVLMAVSQKWPVLLHGLSGVGKTALINRLSAAYGSKVLFIHMDDQMDSKTLVGSYICAEEPGEFRWQPGSLTQAVLNGYWLVFEDIDKAPSDVQSALLPLLEGSSSFATSHGEAVSVDESFRLFATVSSAKHDYFHGRDGKFNFSVFWRKVIVGSPSREDMVEIVNKQYPCLLPYTPKLLDTFQKVNFIAYNEMGRFESTDVALPGDFSKFSLRHLLKFCKRIADLDCCFSGATLSVPDCRKIYQEAVDIFASFSASISHRIFMMRKIAKIWSIPLTEAERLYPPDKPILQNLRSILQVGRVTLQTTGVAMHRQSRPFVNLSKSLHILERIACCVKYNEPILLVGETGTGKTTLVQNLATRLGQPLTVLNLSQQSDVADLLGGFKPTDARSICVPLHHEFVELFCKTFKKRANENRLRYYEKYIMEKKWKTLLSALQKCVRDVLLLLLKEKEPSSGTKRKRPLAGEVFEAWESFSARLNSVHSRISGSSGMSFSFVEGAFVNALRNGHWILLDEVNLAPPEILQRISGVLDGVNGTLCLAERGDISHVERHSFFRLFACMNPATDAGKRDLPHSFRNRFTEFFVDDMLDDEDLILFVSQCMDGICSDGEKLCQIVCFYKVAKNEAEVRLQDGSNQKPHFSLRSLARALEYTRKAEKLFGFERALYDGFCMFFLTSLDGASGKIMDNMIIKYLLSGKMPSNVPFDRYFTERSRPSEISLVNCVMENYVLTESVKGHLRNIARAVYIKRYPVLLQGPTSSGKTSLVHYLASVTGHEFVRINNHDHTDLQEYLGSYITNSLGRLEFQEGALVKAVRMGYWIVLDELNLAPSDVLEALNRLLDDNRELFVPELQETISAHPDFMLFATQNPPTLYGGRKMLSRAFRNRFLEIHVDEIPEPELTTILEKRCKIPQSHAVKMVDIFKDLQRHRQNSKVFAGKHGFITPRDLFKWASRFHMFGKSYEDLAKDGYFLLAERLREESERNVVQEILERRLRVKLLLDNLYPQKSAITGGDFSGNMLTAGFGDRANIIWTKSMWRLYFLVERCYWLREPVLLVGETGGGKTTVCQLLSAALGLRLHTLNCHQYTETSDFIGGFHPIRDRSGLMTKYKDQIEKLKLTKIFHYFAKDLDIELDVDQSSLTLAYLDELVNRYKKESALFHNFTEDDLHDFERTKLGLIQMQRKWQALFFWQDGPLVQAMKAGDLFLLDEISLADDSVLERLNSVLEPERTLSLAEKGGSFLEKVPAHQKFFILATMNPGGDYGKKELSPALRNRFTEIWVPPVSDINELRDIGSQRFYKSELSSFVEPMIKFWEWFNQIQAGRLLTVRDLLSWIEFINETEESLGSSVAFMHGAFLVLLDGLNLGTGMSKNDAVKLRMNCFLFLLEQLKAESIYLDPKFSKIENYGWGDVGIHSDNHSCNNVPSNLFGIRPFFIPKGCEDSKHEGFEFLAPTTCRNALRLLRAMQLSKPVLLEGSPGVGKTSLVVALARYSGHPVVRINLSEQTDMMDLLGSDLPVNNESQIEFGWSNGILLQAIEEGCWVLLDELNLAPQSVLEGLNAILDHRGTVYIPELGKTYTCKSSFRIFACQNPSSQGGGRKGLPKSFLNRFTKVYVDELGADDYLFICQSLYPSIPTELLRKLIVFNNRIYEDAVLHQKYGQVGSPWEFNLRDIIRSCQILKGAPEKARYESFLNVVYAQRMRTADDRREVFKCFEEIFGMKPLVNLSPKIQINPQYLLIGTACVTRNHFQPAKIMRSDLDISTRVAQTLEAMLHCLRHQWLCILVGPPSSGKTSMIRLLAQITGNALNELNLSSSTDVSELLGCFEQYNAFNSCKMVIANIERYVYEYCSLRLEAKWERLINDRLLLVTHWLTFLGSLNYNSNVSSSEAELDPLVEIIEQLKLDLETYKLPVSWSIEDLNKSLKTVAKLQKNSRTQQSAKFEWISGRLLKAIECGEWVVLDNANLCNPSVLDRINSLVEPDGSIIVNESGLIDGKPLVLRPHSNFRIFLTFDPRYGEISRAMRNRGVEIFIMEPSLLLEENDTNPRVSIKNDVKRFLVVSGIPQCKLIDSMAEAHICAKESGLRHGVDITLLELTRWVQLFQQLLISGNQPTWSLQLSWEHTYLSSLGETAGNDTIQHVKSLHLSHENWYEFGPLQGGSFSLPGGWPVPSNLRRFTWFSQETSVKRNCMYLEFLGAQLASYELNSKCSGLLSSYDMKKLKPSIAPVHLLYRLVFPMVSDSCTSMFGNTENFVPDLAYKMLQFAANWAIEQATPNDFELYRLWFEWCSSQLEPYGNFLNSFVSILKKEKDHPIWKCIFNCWFKITHHYHLDDNQHQLPLLSYELVELASSSRELEMCEKHMREAVNCVSLLRLSFQQWTRETEYISEEKKLHSSLLRLLSCLRLLEEEVLSIMMESPFFEWLIDIYCNLLDHHTVFWKGITYSQYEHSVISWNLLKKEALKLQNILPQRLNSLLNESLNLDKLSTFNFDTPKPMLWLYGGHPLLPTSAEVYEKVQQLLTFCNTIWPGTTTLWNQAFCDNSMVLEVALSANIELRHLVMKGVSMSSFISIGGYPENIDTIQAEELYQSLLRRYEYERGNLLSKPENKNVTSCESSSCGCCVLSPESLCQRTGIVCWLATCLLLDWKSFSLDIEILQQLSEIIVLSSHEIYKLRSSISSLLNYALHYSLESSSRCPADFSPHQKLLWLFDAWESVKSVHFLLANVIHEMWFKWHSSMWTCYSEPLKKYIPSFCAEFFLLFQPMRIATMEHIFQDCCPIIEYETYCLKLRVASRCFEEGGPSGGKLLGILLSAARALFEQIIFVHKKSFEDDKFKSLKFLFSSLKENPLTEEKLQAIQALILCSRHKRLTSLSAVIDPLLRELYAECSSCDFLHNLGLGWMHIGVIRFHLLFNQDEPDPTFKNIFKHSQVLEKISLLELEIKVRQECENLAGKSSSGGAQKRLECSLQKLEQKRKKLQEKIVFRDGVVDYNSLKMEISEFVKLVSSCMDLAIGLRDAVDLPLLKDKAFNWQDTASNFISILTEKYSSYKDIIQPVQVAVYEMKLGLSLLLSDALQKEYLRKIEEKNSDRILAAIYSFMRFPRSLSAEAGFIKLNIMPCNSTFRAPAETLNINANLLNKVVAASNGNDPSNMVSGLLVQASVYHITLFLLACSLCNSLIIDNTSFLLMNEIFSYFANMWMGMKDEVKAKEDTGPRDIKFRPRAIMVEDILNVDSSIFGYTDAEENTTSECEEILIEQEFTKVKGTIQESKNLEEEWSAIQESILKNVVLIHNQVFGSSNLVEHPGIFQVSDDDKLQFFADSYKLGIRIIKGLPAVLSSIVEENLVAEHLLHICYEYGRSLTVARQASRVYNVYKEPNAPLMSKMLNPLVMLQQRIKDLLEEWPDHPGLQKVIDVIEVLLHLPFTAPLSQALLGLQLLLNRAHALQENFSRVNLKDLLQPIYCLVLSWQKLELDCWPALLDEVQQQHEANAGKLWFALSSVLQRNISGDVHDRENMFTIQSLEEFIQTASIGEFKKRLQLLLAFHGQLNAGLCLKAYLSHHLKDNLNILYNIFGYYIQFLPLILEHIDTGRRCIEKELIQLLKLFKWGENECSYLSIESFRKIRQKSLKLIKKYNDVLQQPVMVILNQETILQRNKYSAWLDQKSCTEVNAESVQFPMDINKFSNIERFSWYKDWKQKIILSEKSYESIGFLYTTEMASEFEKFQTGWQGVWISLEKICYNAAEFAETWKHGTKNLKKRRALADLLKNLEKCGLSRHRFLTSELEFEKNQPSNSFLQTSFDVRHLLLMEGASFNNRGLCHFQMDSDAKCSLEWHAANQYYFSNLAMKQQLRQISLKFHKDFTMEQVHCATSFLDHLVLIQQEQRSAVYDFSKQLKTLKKWLCSMKHIGTGKSSLSPNQHAFVNCMWKQKNIFDDLHSLSCDVSLLLHCIGDIHTNNCNAAKTEINFSSLIQRFIPVFLQSKESLDKHLLGDVGIISASSTQVMHTIISKEIEDIVMQNFQVITQFGEDIEAFHMTEASNKSMQMLLNRFKELTNKGVMALNKLQMELSGSQSMDPYIDGSISTEILHKHKYAYSQAFKEATELLLKTSKTLFSPFECQSLTDVSLAADITSWKVFFESYVANLNLDLVHDILTKMVIAGEELLSYSGHEKSEVCSQMEMHFKEIHVFLDNFLIICDGILSELLSVHSTVAEMSYMLAHIFASLFSKGFGDAEEQLDDTDNGKFQDATGTGLGEGEGVKDVSDQIDDEAQIPDISDAKGEGLDKSAKVPGKDEKGIEMEEDFAAETFSISEDSDGDEGKDEDDIKLDSLMGENAEGSEAVQEKLWDNDEDGCPDNPNEKYENGSSVEEKDSSSRELRAKDDKADAVDDSTELDVENDRSTGRDENTCSLDDDEISADMMDKSTAFEDPTGIQINDQKKDIDTTDIVDEPPNTTEETEEGKDTIADEPQSSHMEEETEMEPKEMDENIGNEGNASPVVDHMANDESGKHDVCNGTNEAKKDTCDKLDLKPMGINEESTDEGMMESTHNPAMGTDTAEPMNGPQTNESTIILSGHQPNSSESFLAPSSGLPNVDVPKMELSLPDSTGDPRLDAGQLKSQSDNRSVHRINPNPYRNVGDVLKEWKERVEISSDSQELGREVPEDVNDENADEYQFVSEKESGTSQALGSATSEQIANNIEPMEHDADGDHMKQKEDVDMLDVVDEGFEKQCGRMCEASTLRPEIEKLQENLASFDVSMDESDRITSTGILGDSVSFGREFTNHKHLDSGLSTSNADIRKTLESESISDDTKDRSIAEWRRYEFVTTKLSQELAEQLRLVMEPTLASKLQGDYKTGKRINMKKVIPYIASHFRKDKIWLRRTRPNKRDYQVVVAVDDSRSMSESYCSNVALEALITVCRAMSQLEVGQLAVTSFGEKGNIRLLHDFDQPFTVEAGIKMISTLSFKQENTIMDEPMVDLLMYLNSMLDTAVAKARLPSGNNPLQQLILIIADGRFHEKEKLKRFVRDILSRKRMIAFILLDSPCESIMDLMEASFHGEKLSFTKYMNSFPFPYYVVLRNIEALPRTLADLLRQWFELMQSSMSE